MKKHDREYHIKTIRAAVSLCQRLAKVSPDDAGAAKQVEQRLAPLKKSVEHPHLGGRLSVFEHNNLARAFDFWRKVHVHRGDLDEDKWDEIDKAIETIIGYSEQMDDGESERLCCCQQELIDAAYVMPVYAGEGVDEPPTNAENGSDGALLEAGASTEILAANDHGGRIVQVWARSTGATVSHGATLT